MDNIDAAGRDNLFFVTIIWERRQKSNGKSLRASNWVLRKAQKACHRATEFTEKTDSRRFFLWFSVAPWQNRAALFDLEDLEAGGAAWGLGFDNVSHAVVHQCAPEGAFI